MARTVRFAGCICCGSSSSSSGSGSTSGSGSGSGSGSDRDCSGWYCCVATGALEYIPNCDALEAFRSRCAPSISRNGICFNRRVPSVLYVEYGGAAANNGTIAYQWSGGPFGTGFYLWNDGQGPGTGETPGPGYVDVTICGQYAGTQIAICGELGEGQLTWSAGAPGGATVCGFSYVGNNYFTVQSWEPFETDTLTLVLTNSTGMCACEGQTFTIKITGGPNDIDPDEALSGPYATEAEARAACASSSGSSTSTMRCCANGRSLPHTFDGSWEQTAGGGSPASGTMTFTYDDGSGVHAFLGEGWYSTTWYNGPPEGGTCQDDFFAVYQCVETAPGSGMYSWRLRVYGSASGYYQDLGYSGSGLWTFNGPMGECTGSEQLIRIPYGTQCEDIGSTDGGGGDLDPEDPDPDPPLMAARTQIVEAAAVPDRFALPLCQYEGAAMEYASCGCEGKHVRNCDNPYQGGQDPEGRTVPDIDRCQREYQPTSTLQSCERCPYRKAVEGAPDAA